MFFHNAINPVSFQTSPITVRSTCMNNYYRQKVQLLILLHKIYGSVLSTKYEKGFLRTFGSRGPPVRLPLKLAQKSVTQAIPRGSLSFNSDIRDDLLAIIDNQTAVSINLHFVYRPYLENATTCTTTATSIPQAHYPGPKKVLHLEVSTTA